MTGPSGIVDVYEGDASAARKLSGSLGAAVQRAASDGVRVIIAKCTEGRSTYTDPTTGVVRHGYVDPAWLDWYVAATMHGLPIFAYHFASATSSGTDQAQWLLQNAGAHGPVAGVVLDRESNERYGTMAPSNAMSFLRECKRVTGRWPLLYTNESDLRAMVASLPAPDVLDLKGVPLWVACWANRAPITPWPWTLWQYQGAGSGPNERPSDAAVYPASYDGLGHVDASVAASSEDLAGLLIQASAT
jgi:GH25 family lysozyme M1 (1,4-beta-N-acetylmuramidase)